MTTEIIIANKNSIIMAADSVVTIENKKTYDSAEKLFFLSNEPPLGMTIFGSANFEGVPMETLIKEFRKEYNFKKNPDIIKIKDAFLKFMAKNTIKTDIKELISEKMKKFKYNVKSNINIKMDPKQELPEFLDEIKELKTIDNDLKELIPENLSENEKTKMFEDLKENFLKFLISDSCGIVIAGFNKNSHFPSFFHAKAVFNYKGKIKIHNEFSKINHMGSFILPIAQKDVIVTFITGIDDKMEEGLIINVDGLIENYSNNLKTELNKNLDIDKELLKKINREIDRITANYDKHNLEFTTALYQLKNDNIKPILHSINSLPKEELVEIAESLIKTTSVKRKVSSDIESVGGFIDVAIITKGDGFIWKKRKQFIDPDLNPTIKPKY